MLCYSQEDPVQQEDTPDNEAETFDLYLTSPDITALIFREVTPRTTATVSPDPQSTLLASPLAFDMAFPTMALFSQRGVSQPRILRGVRPRG